MDQKLFQTEAALILAEIVSSYPTLIDFESDEEIDGADLVEALTHHLFFNLSPESKAFLKAMI